MVEFTQILKQSHLSSLGESLFAAYRQHKRLKSIGFVPEDILRDFLDGKDIYYKNLDKEDVERFYEKAIVPHASINRLTSTTTGGELFFESLFAVNEFCLLVKINRWAFEDEPEKLLPAIYNLLPLGGNKSTGMGGCKVELMEAPSWLLNYMDGGGGYIYSLSEFLYSPNLDFQESYYDVQVKRPAVENYFGRNSKIIWKGPMLTISAGAVMKVKDNSGYYGKLKQVSHNLYHYGYAFPLYLRGEKPC